MRLPELYCGFARHGNYDLLAISYPVSCSPQAWAAGSISLIVSSMLGLELNLTSQRLTISPSLPDWLNEVTIQDMCVLGHRGTLHVRRVGAGYTIEAPGLPVHM